ncbi:MAG: DUF2510 domain-containing protein [Actinomycetota bacterium]
MIPAGWYDDPANPSFERWWDGERWTEHTRALPPVGPPQQAPFTVPPPPVPGEPSPGVHRYPDGKLNQLGDWINRAFAVTFEQIGPLSILFLIPFAVFAGAYLIVHLALTDVVIVDGDFEGFKLGLLVLAAVVGVAAMVVIGASYLAAHYLFYGALVGHPPDWQTSLSTGFRRLPMLIAFSFLIGVGVGVPAVVAILIAVFISPLLLLVVIPALIVLFVWVFVKASVVTVSIAVARPGTTGLTAGWNATNGFFWPIFGRLLLMGLMVNIGQFIPQMVGGQLWPMVFGPEVSTGPTGELLINGRLPSTLDSVAVADVLPNPLAFILVAGILGFAQYIIQAIGFAGTTALYADTGGPNLFGHTRR